MMTRAGLTSVIAALPLLASAAPASAEWVLWKQVTISTLRPSVSPKPWEIVRVTPERDACEAVQAETIKNIANNISDAQSRGLPITLAVGPSTIISRFHGLWTEIETQYFECLPDTVDPREPETKCTECPAWVLWREHFITTELLQDNVIKIDPISQAGAFTDSTQCDLAAHDEASKPNIRMSSERRKIVERLEYGVCRSLIVSADQPDFTDYRCFPDTVDPRGARGRP